MILDETLRPNYRMAVDEPQLKPWLPISVGKMWVYAATKQN